LEESLSLDPGLADARCELGQLDLDQGQLDAAGANLRAVLDKQPRHAKANIALGDVMLRSGNLAEAKTRYETAIAADPQSGPAHYKLSTVLLRLHEPERAAKERALGASLNADALRASKTVLVLAEPDGTLLAASARKARQQ
jgi:Tfp pilus assembly protein PilF